MRAACYVERRCLAFLMSAIATRAMFEPRSKDLGCDGQSGLTANGKA